MLNSKDIIKEFLRRGGLRCEVLVSGKIKIGDKIRIL
jgi:MOSC domain-containing protein YiiM